MLSPTNVFFGEIPTTDAKGVTLELCESISTRKMFRDIINEHHRYMDYKDTCNRRLNWLVWEACSGNIVGAVGINSALLALGPRDTFIGWDKDQRMKGLNKLANNYRFCLIKENATIKNIGTITLKALRSEGVLAWKKRYGDDLLLLETLVKPPWTGAVYKADNWQYVGMTKGFSFSKAPIGLWKKEKSARGEMARNHPEEAIKKYAVNNVAYSITESEPKHIFLKILNNDWKKILE